MNQEGTLLESEACNQVVYNVPALYSVILVPLPEGSWESVRVFINSVDTVLSAPLKWSGQKIC